MRRVILFFAWLIEIRGFEEQLSVDLFASSANIMVAVQTHCVMEKEQPGKAVSVYRVS